ncbi:transposase [Actinopolyspora mzabensis]|uniref:transposase n=1 Tax=Actinopolyspora mzabensis TaxID=995066 RepID=UPI0015A136CF
MLAPRSEIPGRAVHRPDHRPPETSRPATARTTPVTAPGRPPPLADKRTGRKPSNRWHTAQVRIAKLHTRISHARRDGLHQLSTRLVRQFDTVVVEDLNVSGMVRNRRLARRMAGPPEAGGSTSSPSCGATETSRLETHPRAAPLATGIAAGRPRPSGPGPTPRRKATARERLHVS